jgi:hypothetical protein
LLHPSSFAFFAIFEQKQHKEVEKQSTTSAAEANISNSSRNKKKKDVGPSTTPTPIRILKAHECQFSLHNFSIENF